MAKFKVQEIGGVIPALITPFDKDENFDEQRMRRLVDHLLKKGVDGLYLTGSTGEGFLMTPEERKKVVEVVADQVQGRVPLIAHVGAIGTKISMDLARQAASAGVDAVSSVPPFYWKFTGEELFKYYKDITEAAGIPMIVYNIALAGLVGFDQVKKFASIEGVAGVKYTATTHFEIMRMKEELGRDFLIYSGCDEMALSGLSFGADGIIGSFYNLMPEIFITINEAMKKKDLETAGEKQRIANIIINYSTQKNYVGIMKRALAWMGLDAGYCRSPFHNFDREEEARIKEDFKTLKETHGIKGIDFLDAL